MLKSLLIYALPSEKKLRYSLPDMTSAALEKHKKANRHTPLKLGHMKLSAIEGMILATTFSPMFNYLRANVNEKAEGHPHT